MGIIPYYLSSLKHVKMGLSNLFLFISLAITTGCSDVDKQNKTADVIESNSPEMQTATVTSNDKLDLKQQGNYASLFNSPNCNVISVEEISAAFAIPIVDMNLKERCSYKSDFGGDKTWYLDIRIDKISKASILKEIESFKSDETGQLELKLSETGDTYFGIQHAQGYLSIFNTNYESSVLISYGSVGVSRNFTKEERLQHKEFAVKLANSLLEKHKK